MIMLNTYGYKPNERCYTINDIDNLEYNEPKTVAMERSEAESFFEEDGPDVVDSVGPNVFQTF